MRKFKFTLDRKSEENQYFSLTRSILECADDEWDNHYHNKAYELDKKKKKKNEEPALLQTLQNLFLFRLSFRTNKYTDLNHEKQNNLTPNLCNIFSPIIFGNTTAYQLH